MKKAISRFLCASRNTALILICLTSFDSRGDDWPQWRGPKRDAVWNETNLLQTFPAEGLKIRWTSPVGWGWSSPVISGGRVFVTDSELEFPDSTRERVHCFDETTGKQIWSFAYNVAYPDWVFTPGQEAGPSATPIIDEGKLYTLGGNGHLHCLDTKTGDLIWDRMMSKKYEIEELKCRASPLIEGNLLILLIGGKPNACVVAIDKRTGKEVWKALDETVSNSSPIIISTDTGRQLIVWTGESVTSLTPESGKLIWQHPLRTSNNDSIATPLSHGELLLVGGLMLNMGTGKKAVNVLWPESKVPARRILSNTSTALFRSDYIYSARSHGELVCLEATTGKEIWKNDTVTDLLGGASIHLTPIENSDSVFLFTDRGDLILARLTPSGYDEISRTHLLNPTYQFGSRKVAWTPPAYANHQIFARNDKELICTSLKAEP